jgi:hypothetical protein
MSKLEQLIEKANRRNESFIVNGKKLSAIDFIKFIKANYKNNFVDKYSKEKSNNKGYANDELVQMYAAIKVALDKDIDFKEI